MLLQLPLGHRIIPLACRISRGHTVSGHLKMNTSRPGASVAPAVSDLQLPKGLPDNVMRAIWLAIACTAFFCAGDTSAKLLTFTLPAGQVAWMRYAVFVAIVLPVTFATRGRTALSTRRPGWQVARGCAVFGSSLLFILGLRHLQISEATVINFVSPILMMALSVPMLGERVGIRRWTAAGVCFVGVLIVVQPGTDAFTPAALFPLGAALCWAFAGIVTRLMGPERPDVTLAWSSVVGLVLLTFVLPFGWEAPTWGEIGIVVLMGIFSTVGNWLAVLAFRLAPAAVLAPFFYLQLVSAAVYSYFLFGVVPEQATFVGGAVIAASGIYVAHRERVRRRKEVEAVKTTL
jgi:drug/metabolite transporter (DMT)-like permease